MTDTNGLNSYTPDDLSPVFESEPVGYRSQDPGDHSNSGGHPHEQATAEEYRERSQTTLRKGRGEVIDFPAPAKAENSAPTPNKMAADGPHDDEPDDAPLPPGVYPARFCGFYTNFKHPQKRKTERGIEYRGKCVVQYEVIGGEHAGRMLERHFNVWFPKGERAGSVHFLPADKGGRLFREACTIADKRVRPGRCVSELRSNPRVWVLVSSVEQDAEGFAIESFASYSRIERIIGNIELMPESKAREKAGV